MNSKPPAPDRRSSGFEALHPKVQRWIWDQGWPCLREIQELAIPVLLGGEEDAILASRTASGKTEAAFLPIVSRLLGEPPLGLAVLAVSPLKALINDQADRLEALCRGLDLEVHRWHGDVGAGRKRRLLAAPSGILLITPESLEALFVRHGTEVHHFFRGLAFVVVDELHAFMGSERGRQLQSLLHRVEVEIDRRVPRVGLSATLGDMERARDFLRPGLGASVRLLVSTAGGQELKLQVRGYLDRDPLRKLAARKELLEADDEPEGTDLAAPVSQEQIARHLFEKLRGGKHIVFANARATVEEYADRLRRLCEARRVPNEFWPHHGSLAKELREDAEAFLKDPTRPATLLATTTLELGIDVGYVETIGQIGAPPTVASLRQRLGRSGRQGTPAVLRVYLREQEVDPRTPPQDALRAELVETIAKVELLLDGWYEPPEPGELHLSTLVQQILSLLAQRGGFYADEAWRVLCESGPFGSVDAPRFASLLRALGRHELISQMGKGEIVIGSEGERLVNHYSFYSAFTTAEEYRLTSGGRDLGTVPISFPLLVGVFLIFAGRRWRVVAVDDEHRVVDLVPAKGGTLPSFGGSGAAVHDRVRSEMWRIYTGAGLPAFLDATARELLTEGRDHFRRYRLAETALLPWGEDTLLFPWRGDRVLNTLGVWLRSEGLRVEQEGLALALLGSSAEEAQEVLARLARASPPDPLSLAQAVRNKSTEKHHRFLPEDLLAADYAGANLDAAGAWSLVQQLAASGFRPPP